MFECVGVGDPHVPDDKGQGGLAKYIERPESYIVEEIERVLKWARKHHISHCVIYGDVCENPRMSYESILALRSMFKRNRDIEFIVYRGNHDSLAKDAAEGHSLEILMSYGMKNVQFFVDDTYLEFGKQKVKICPWPSTAFDPKCLNFGHIEVNGSQLDSGRKIENDELSTSKAVVCMGHLHKNHRVRNTYYSGTLYQTNFGEPLPKFFHHIKYTSPQDYEILNIPFDPKYKLFNCVVETEDDVKALPTDPHHLVKLVIKDGADLVVPNRPNIVINKTFKTKQDLATILTEDLMNGQELVLNTAEYFAKWIAEQSIPQRLKKMTTKLRERILSGNH